MPENKTINVEEVFDYVPRELMIRTPIYKTDAFPPEQKRIAPYIIDQRALQKEIKKLDKHYTRVRTGDDKPPKGLTKEQYSSMVHMRREQMHNIDFYKKEVQLDNNDQIKKLNLHYRQRNQEKNPTKVNKRIISKAIREDKKRESKKFIEKNPIPKSPINKFAETAAKVVAATEGFVTRGIWEIPNAVAKYMAPEKPRKAVPNPNEANWKRELLEWADKTNKFVHKRDSNPRKY